MHKKLFLLFFMLSTVRVSLGQFTKIGCPLYDNGLWLGIGTKSADENGLSSGRVYVFVLDNNQWNEFFTPVPGQIQFNHPGQSLFLNSPARDSRQGEIRPMKHEYFGLITA